MQKNIELKPLVASAVGVLLLISLLQFLPSRYYFNFSSVVAGDNSSQFFAYKEHAAPATFCRLSYIQADWDAAKLDPALADACAVIERFEDRVYSVYPSEASVDGQRLNSDDYRREMAAYLLQIREDAAAIDAYASQVGLPVDRRLRGLSETEIEAVMVSAQDVTLWSLLRYIVNDEDVNVYDAVTQVQARYPDLQQRAASTRAQLNTDRGSLRQSAGWVPLAERFLREEYSAEIAFLEEKIYGIPTDNIVVAFLLKLLPPLAAGFLVAAILRSDRAADVGLGAALVAFLLCWPVVLLWNVVVAQEFRSSWPIVFALYASYILAYYFLAKLGAQLGLNAAASRLPEAMARSVDWTKVFSTTATSLVTSAIVAILTWTFASAG